jgi:general secretion pathway protein G
MKITPHFVLILLSLISVSCRDEFIMERTNKTQSDFQAITHRLKVFREMNGRLPTTEEGLKVLIERPADAGPSWRQLLTQIPNDSWGRPYRYVTSSTKPQGYDLFSLGENPENDSDDIHSDDVYRE